MMKSHEKRSERRRNAGVSPLQVVSSAALGLVSMACWRGVCRACRGRFVSEAGRDGHTLKRLQKSLATAFFASAGERGRVWGLKEWRFDLDFEGKGVKRPFAWPEKPRPRRVKTFDVPPPSASYALVDRLAQQEAVERPSRR